MVKQNIRRIANLGFGIASAIYGMTGCGKIDPIGLPNNDIYEGRTLDLYEKDIQESPDNSIYFGLDQGFLNGSYPAYAKVEALDSFDGRAAPFNAMPNCDNDGNCYIAFKDNNNQFYPGSTWAVKLNAENAFGIDSGCKTISVRYHPGNSPWNLTDRVEELESHDLENLLKQSTIKYFDNNGYPVDVINTQNAYARLSIPKDLNNRLTSGVSVNIIERSNPNSWIVTNYGQPEFAGEYEGKMFYDVPLNFSFDRQNPNKLDWEVIDPQFALTISNGTFTIGDSPGEVNLNGN